MKNILEQFSGLNVLVVGDIMIDAYYMGKVERISPEAPVPVVDVTQKENRLGGAANVALNIKALGANPLVCSVIGNDKEGNDLLELFKQQDINTSGIIQSTSRITTVKLRIMAQSHQMLRVDSEMKRNISATESSDLINCVTQLLPKADVLIFEDYDKGVLTSQNIAQIIAEANKLNVPVVVDPKKNNFNNYNEATLFKPNLKELKEGLKIDLDLNNKLEFEQSIALMLQTMNIQYALITMSEKGVMITDGKTFTYIPAHVRKIADVSGAGDTVISVAALCLASKQNSTTLAKLANLAGGLVCEEVGVVPINKARFKAEIDLLN